ncbi:MAG: hypothetical protein V3U21_01795 [Thermodesulfobacteriota bacterium]
MNHLNSEEGLRVMGFEGFVSVMSLIDSNCINIPKCKGVYLVLFENGPPRFNNTSVCGHFKGRNPLVSLDKLISKWVDSALIINIGKAGGSGSGVTLHSRLKQYMRFGEGKPVGHWGGRYIWQIENWTELILCWKQLPLDEPRKVEKELINEFVAQYGKLPFANRTR